MILVADSGGTKTDWALLDGVKVAYYQTPGMHPDTINEAMAVFIELDGLSQNVDHVFFYGTGCAKRERASIVEEKLEQWFPSAKVSVFSDLMAVAHVSLGKNKGLVGVLGTGSSMAVYNGKKLEFPVASPGKEIGDPGSGTKLGKGITERLNLNDLPAILCHDLRALMQANYTSTNEKNIRLVGFLYDNLSNDVVREYCITEFENYFLFYSQTCKNAENKKLFMVGSVAYYFKDLIIYAAKKYNLEVGGVIQKPINELVKFYSSKSSSI